MQFKRVASAILSVTPSPCTLCLRPQVDYLLRRLMLLSERIAATESLLSIEMDHRRNELVALDLFVTCVGASFAFVGMVAGGCGRVAAGRQGGDGFY